MPLNSPEDYEKLGEHLSQLDPALAAFATRHGNTIYPKLSGGRYPNRRITEEGRMFRSIVIQMEFDERGERYDRFFPEIPYSIWGGAWIDDAKQATRCSAPSILIERLPFSMLTRTFHLHLAHFHEYLSRVTESYV